MLLTHAIGLCSVLCPLQRSVSYMGDELVSKDIYTRHQKPCIIHCSTADNLQSNVPLTRILSNS